MRPAARSGPAPLLPMLCMLFMGLSACGKDPGGAGVPSSSPKLDGAASVPAESDGAGATETHGEADEPDEPRLELETEFHRTRFGLGTGVWVLGIVHNPHTEPVVDVRLRVRLLDEAETLVGQAKGRVARPLAPGERAGVAVLVPEPVAHDQLQLGATAILDPEPTREPLPLRLEHDPPQPADFGGWFIVGRVENTGPAPVEGARVEIQGLDKSGKLLGIDWLALDPVAAGAITEFVVGGLRYEEAPTQFLLEVRGPARD